MLVTGLGVFSACATTVAWAPQVVHSYRRGSPEGLSLPYLATMITGLGSWLAYGALRDDIPLMVANAASLALVLCLVAMRVRPRRNGPAATESLGTTQSAKEVSAVFGQRFRPGSAHVPHEHIAPRVFGGSHHTQHDLHLLSYCLGPEF